MVGTPEERVEELNRLYPCWESHTLWTRFEKNAKKYEDREFLVFDRESLTYGQVLKHVEKMSDFLIGLGVRSGDHVAVLLRNCPEYIFLIFALSRLGAVKIPLNANMKETELSCVLFHSDADYLISHRDYGESVYEKLPRLRAVVVKGRIIYRSEETGHSKTVSETAVADQDPFAMSDIMFTSGSTARPKGVIMTHDMLWRTAYSSCLCRYMEEGRRMFVPIPLFHAFAYVEGLLAMVLMGGTVIMTEEKFSTGHCIEMMKTHRANDIICVSLIMTNILSRENLHPGDLPDLHAAYWASSCPEWVWDKGRRDLGITDIITSYGMTECGSTATMLSATDPADCVKWNNGRLKPGGCAVTSERGTQLEARIVDPKTGDVLPVGVSGELCLRGATVTPGYYNCPEINSQVFDSEGWFHTGDICVFDENGYMTFQGRNNDMFKINGENVSPLFLDRVMGGCPRVRAVETVGILHEKYGEVGVAFIDTGGHVDGAAEDIWNYCKENLAEFQIPRYFIFLEQNLWPRTGSGKTTKTHLRRLAQENVNDPDTELTIVDVVEQLRKENRQIVTEGVRS